VRRCEKERGGDVIRERLQSKRLSGWGEGGLGMGMNKSKLSNRARCGWGFGIEKIGRVGRDCRGWGFGS
jgi:hypothetical protein